MRQPIPLGGETSDIAAKSDQFVAHDPSPWVRTIIGVFVVVNLTTIAIVNLPDALFECASTTISRGFSPQTAYQMEFGRWTVRRYAHLVGLDNRWQMFGRQSRFNWWYVIRGEYGHNEATRLVLLPIPHQTGRDFWQRNLFDFKERKFLLNLYNNPFGRACYSHYLTELYPTYDEQPLVRIRWDLGYQMILPPDQAVATGRLLDARCEVRPFDSYYVPEHSAAKASGGGSAGSAIPVSQRMAGVDSLSVLPEWTP